MMWYCVCIHKSPFLYLLFSSLCTLACTGFTDWFCDFSCTKSFSNIPPAWCVMSHLLRQVWLGNISHSYWMWAFISSLATRGPVNHTLVSLPYSVVMAALCTVSSNNSVISLRNVNSQKPLRWSGFWQENHLFWKCLMKGPFCNFFTGCKRTGRQSSWSKKQWFAGTNMTFRCTLKPYFYIYTC